jgi:hypothetical protein
MDSTIISLVRSIGEGHTIQEFNVQEELSCERVPDHQLNSSQLKQWTYEER